MEDNRTKLQRLLQEIGISQAELARQSGLETYQVSLIASGTRPDCYLSTAKKICTALEKLTKVEIMLDDIFGDSEYDEELVEMILKRRKELAKAKASKAQTKKQKPVTA